MWILRIGYWMLLYLRVITVYLYMHIRTWGRGVFMCESYMYVSYLHLEWRHSLTSNAGPKKYPSSYHLHVKCIGLLSLLPFINNDWNICCWHCTIKYMWMWCSGVCKDRRGWGRGDFEQCPLYGTLLPTRPGQSITIINDCNKVYYFAPLSVWSVSSNKFSVLTINTAIIPHRLIMHSISCIC